MANQQWPTDTEWRKFAARIADGVTVFLALGGVIYDSKGAPTDCRCPLGVLTPSDPFPTSWYAHSILQIPASWATGFVHGFDGRRMPLYVEVHEPSFNLGRAYRRRFIDKETT